MSKKDKIKEELSILRDDFKNYFIVFMTIATASFASFYQVVLKSVPVRIAFIAGSGLVTALFIAILLKKTRIKIDEKLDILEEID